MPEGQTKGFAITRLGRPPREITSFIRMNYKILTTEGGNIYGPECTVTDCGRYGGIRLHEFYNAEEAQCQFCYGLQIPLDEECEGCGSRECAGECMSGVVGW